MNHSFQKLSYKLDEINIREVTSFIMNEYIKSNKREILFINIGSDRFTSDAFGPMLGSYMEDKKCPFNFFGTLEHSIHSVNLQTEIPLIKKNYPDAFIIATDACIGRDVSFNTFAITNTGIRPGSGAGKIFNRIGDVSIYFITLKQDESATQTHVSLGKTYKAVKEIYKVIEELCKAFPKNKEITKDVI